jgi:hypothetical protein
MAKKETTTTYRWGDEQVIRRIDVRQQKNGWAVAYLYADPSEEARAKRTNIRAAIRLKGWGTLSDSRDGQFVLRVTGLRSGDELVDLLHEQGFIRGRSQTTVAEDKGEQATGLWSTIKSRSLRASGIFATIGNAMSITQGFHRMSDPRQGKSIGQIGMGASFAVADLPLALVDEKDNSRQLSLLLKKLRKHYDRDGIEIPQNASIFVETSNKGKTVGERTQDFLHDYANQIKCFFEVVASGWSMYAGREQESSFKKYVPLIWGPGFLASLLIPEKKIDEEKYEQAGLLGRAWMKIQSNPLVIGGTLGYSNTIATYGSAIKEQRKELAKPIGDRTHFYRWDYIIPTDMIAANGLYAMSKKTVGGGIKSEAMVQDAYRIAAQIINKQPESQREKAVESTAKFFSERMEIKEHYPQALERLRQELDSQRANPWFEQQGLAPYRSAPKSRRDEAPDMAAGLSQAMENPGIPQTVVSSRELQHMAATPATDLGTRGA